jgi:hypothetical protein
MTHCELQEAIATLDKNGRLSKHRAEQVNRILRWAEAHWDTFEPTLHEWLCENEGAG